MENMKMKLQEYLQEQIRKISIEEKRLSEKFGVDVKFKEEDVLCGCYHVCFTIDNIEFRGQGEFSVVGYTYAYGSYGLELWGYKSIDENDLLKIVNAEGFDNYANFTIDEKHDFVDNVLNPPEEEETEKPELFPLSMAEKCDEVGMHPTAFE